MSIETILLPAESILVSSDRQRKEFPERHVAELAKSIERDGLLHAIAVTETGELISGFCRLSAIRQLSSPYRYGNLEVPAGMIPCLKMDNLDSGELFRLELEENLRRKNLSPVEEAQAIAKLHTLCISEVPAGTWFKSDTGKKLDEIRGVGPDTRSASSQSKEIVDAILLDSFAQDPDICKATTKAEALRKARKKLEMDFMAGLGALSSNTSSEHNIVEGDLREVLPLYPDLHFAGIICDPPYGMDAETFGEQAFHIGHQYDDNKDSALEITGYILQEGYRICKEDSHIYLFCDIRHWPELYNQALEAGWHPYATPLIWHKPNVGHAPQPGYFLRRYEAILFAYKGARKLRTSSSDVLEFAAEGDKFHAAQKPTALYEKLMSLSFLPGESVLDPCAGSGTIFRAAKKLSLKATGIELDSQYAARCKLVISE